MKAYWINVTDRTITEVEYQDLADLQRIVGGYIEVAKSWSTGDTLYVDEEGLLKDKPGSFMIKGRADQVLAGNGVVVGREIGDTTNTNPPRISLDELKAEVLFLD